MKKLYWTHTYDPFSGQWVDRWSDTPGEPGHTPPPVEVPVTETTETRPAEKPAKEQNQHGKRTFSRK